MPRIYVEFVRMKQIANTTQSVSSKLDDLRSDFLQTVQGLDWEVKFQSNINSSANQIAKKLRLYEEILKKYHAFLNDAYVLYEKLDSEESEIELASLADAQDKIAKTFDDDKGNGTYGADQGDMAHNKKGIWFFGFRWFEDEDLYAYIRLHSKYQNYSQTQIADLMERINSEGCGYIAMVNNIFVEYEGREAEFERKFGFPMYDKNGKANYDYLIVDFYANTDDQYYVDETMGATALVNDVLLQYRYKKNGEWKWKTEEFKSKYGCDPVLNGDRINPEARQKVLDEYQGSSVVTMDVSGTTPYSLENRFKHYMEQKGIACTTKTLGGNPMPSSTEIDGYLDNGQNVNIAVGNFNLYDENGKTAANDVGDHWMTITGTTDDGRYIVSSWGKRYYLKPSELSGANFYITDISP